MLHGLDFPAHFEWLGNSLRTGSTGTVSSSTASADTAHRCMNTNASLASSDANTGTHCASCSPNNAVVRAVVFETTASTWQPSS